MTEIPNDFTKRVSEEWEPTDSIMAKKIFAMMLYAYPVLQNFPKTEKFTMAADIKRNMDTLMELTIELDNKHFKKSTLTDIDTTNKKLKKYVRLAFLLRYISQRQYKHWTELLTEIGKIIGGRIQSAKQ